MRRALRWTSRILLVLAVVGAVVFFTFGPMLFERAVNRVAEGGPWPVSERARALNARLTIIDLHGDSLLFKRDLTERAGYGHVDLPRLRDGNVALQVFSSVTKTPRDQNYERNSGETDNITLLAIGQLQPPRTWSSLLQRSLWHAEKLRRAAAKDPTLRIVRRVQDLDEGLAARAAGQPRVLALLGIEGMQNLEGRRENLDVLFESGFRMGGLAHFFDNELAGSVHGEAKHGLTPLGRDILRAMEAKGMLVDVAHSSHDTIRDVLALATRPVISSHGGVKGTCDNNRNLTDEELRGIARTGGVVGIGLWDAAVCTPTPQATARAMRHVRDLVGIETVALGSDWDGVVFTSVDASGTAAITQALIDEGFTDEEISAAMGGNALRVLRATLPGT